MQFCFMSIRKGQLVGIDVNAAFPQTNISKSVKRNMGTFAICNTQMLVTAPQ